MDIAIVGFKRSGKTLVLKAIERMFSSKLDVFSYRFGNISRKKAGDLMIWIEKPEDYKMSDDFHYFNEIRLLEADIDEWEKYEYLRYANIKIFVSGVPPNFKILKDRKEMEEVLAYDTAKKFGKSILLNLLGIPPDDEAPDIEEDAEGKKIIKIEEEEKLPDEIVKVLAKKIDVSNTLNSPYQMHMYADILLLQDYNYLSKADLWLIRDEKKKGNGIKTSGNQPKLLNVKQEKTTVNVKEKLIEELKKLNLVEGRRGCGVYYCQTFKRTDKEFNNFMIRLSRMLR